MAVNSKYNAKKTTVDGIEFDSQKEARRFRELVLLERAGLIQDLQRQVKFVLIPTQYERYERYSTKTGKRLQDGIRRVEQEVSYGADFEYTINGKQFVEDSKGYRTADYILKRKMMLYFHNIRIKET